MAAPLGFKDFTTGEVLTAADVDGYLMQGIWVFANATARDAAVTSPQEGNSCYLKDTDVIQVYSGSSWVIKSGGSSPLTTKGDLYTYSTTDTRLGVGANGTVLTADSAEATGLKWAAAAGGSNFVALNGAGTSLNGSSNVSITGLSGYDKFYVYVYNASSNSGTSSVVMTINSDTTNKYGGDAMALNANSTAINIVGTNFTGLNGRSEFSLGASSAASSLNATMLIFGGNSSGAKIVQKQAGVGSVSGNYADIDTVIYTGTSVISSLQFKSASTFDSGTVYIYGSA